MKLTNPNSAPESRMSRPTGESVNLDVLRSIAVLLVFCDHYFVWQLNDWRTGTALWRFGQLGVLIFFVHTCLVLMWSLERSDHQGLHVVLPFYVRRVMRIYPLSVFCVIAAYIFDARWDQVSLWQNLTLTQYFYFRGSPKFPPNLGTLWTLPLEVEMYVLLPFLFLIFRKRPILFLGLLWIVTIPLAWFQLQFGEAFAILRYVPCFLGGVIAWRLMREQNCQRFSGKLWPLAIAVTSLLWMFSNGKDMPFCIAAFGLTLGLAIPLFHEIRSARVAMAAKIIARYSYGIYLSHFPIMVYLMHPPDPTGPQFKYVPPMLPIRHFVRPIQALLAVTLTAGASYLLYHGIEKPGIALGRRMANRIARGGVSWRPKVSIQNESSTETASLE